MNWTSTRSSLITRLRSPRDEEAWRRFDRLYGQVIVRYACRRGLRLPDAEDVRQSVLMSLVRAMPSFVYQRDRGKFRSYLGRAVGNAIHRARHRTHQTREWLSGDMERVPTDPVSPELDHVFEREWVDHHLRTALERLRRTVAPRTLQAFTRLMDGASPEAVAAEMDTTAEAVRKVRQRMRTRMRQLVRQQVAEERRLLEDPDGGMT